MILTLYIQVVGQHIIRFLSHIQLHLPECSIDIVKSSFPQIDSIATAELEHWTPRSSYISTLHKYNTQVLNEGAESIFGRVDGLTDGVISNFSERTNNVVHVA